MLKKRPSIPDADLLEMLETGLLQVDLNTGVVTKEGRILKPTIVGTDGKNGTRKRIEICNRGRKRSIVLAKLIYMAGNKMIVPTGFEVHHIDEDRYGDRFSNLIMLTHSDHRKMHSVQPDVLPELPEGVPF